jgi:hypothetical protein
LTLHSAWIEGSKRRRERGREGRGDITKEKKYLEAKGGLGRDGEIIISTLHLAAIRYSFILPFN